MDAQSPVPSHSRTLARVRRRLVSGKRSPESVSAFSSEATRAHRSGGFDWESRHPSPKLLLQQPFWRRASLPSTVTIPPEYDRNPDTTHSEDTLYILHAVQPIVDGDVTRAEPGSGLR